MNRTSTLLIALIFFNLLALVLNIGLGSVSISISDILGSLSGSEKVDAVLTGIVLEFRLPRGLTAMLAGSALSVSGLMMQTVFEIHSRIHLCLGKWGS